MKASDFIVEDVEDGHLVNIRSLLEKEPALFENQQNWINFKEVLSRLSAIQDPAIGEQYSVMSLISIPVAPILSIKGIKSPAKLVDIESNYYIFETSTGHIRFPEGQQEGGDLLKQTLLYESESELEKARIMLHLSLVGWRIKDELE